MRRANGRGTRKEVGTGIPEGTGDERADAGTGEIRDAGTGTEEIGTGDGEEIRDGIFADPGEVFGTGTGAEETGTTKKRGRGRPKGSGKKARAKEVPTSLEGIEGILLSLHTMGAAITKIPELNLSEEEAAKLTQGITRVAALYDFGASEKTLAWINLAVVAGGVYGTRMFAYSLRTKEESARKKAGPKPIEFPSPASHGGLHFTP